jgi:hypothetical protein
VVRDGGTRRERVPVVVRDGGTRHERMPVPRAQRRRGRQSARGGERAAAGVYQRSSGRVNVRKRSDCGREVSAVTEKNGLVSFEVSWFEVAALMYRRTHMEPRAFSGGANAIVCWRQNPRWAICYCKARRHT